MAVKVEWGSSVILEFHTQQFNTTTNEWETTDADTFHAVLETSDIKPQYIEDLIAKKIDVGKYYVLFYADKETTEPGKAYYVAFYWEKAGIKMVEREMVVVVTDIKQMD